MEVITKQIKQGAIGSLYLLYGNEEYMKEQYVNQIKNSIIDPAYEMMNFERYNGKEVSAEQIIDFAETIPFMSDRKMIILKDSGFFKTGRKDETVKFTQYVDQIPTSVCIVFIESDIDKRSALYKKISKAYTAVEFTTPSDKELLPWVQKELKKHNITMSKELIEYFIHIVPSGMESIANEIKKIVDYKQTGTVTKEEVDHICTRSLDTRIFELVKMLGNKDTKGALKIYSNLLEVKESPIGILAMMARQFRMILKVKYMRHEGHTNQSIANRTGLRTFMINECVGQARNFTFAQLESAIGQCLEIDEKTKTGMINPELGVELILITYAR